MRRRQKRRSEAHSGPGFWAWFGAWFRAWAPNVGPSQSVDGATYRPIPGYATRLTDITLGGVAIDDGPATVMQYKRRDEVGVFGPNSFPGKLTEIDFPRSRIRILPDTPETPTPLRRSRQRRVIRMSMTCPPSASPCRA